MAKAIAVSAGWIDVQFDRDFGFFQGKGIEEGVLHADRIVLRHRNEGRWTVSRDLDFRCDFVAVVLQSKISGIDQHAEIGTTTELIGFIDAWIAPLAGGAERGGKMSAGREAQHP